MERRGFAAFRAGGEVVSGTSARPAWESGGGLSPTTALQNAGARFGKGGDYRLRPFLARKSFSETICRGSIFVVESSW